MILDNISLALKEQGWPASGIEFISASLIEAVSIA